MRYLIKMMMHDGTISFYNGLRCGPTINKIQTSMEQTYLIREEELASVKQDIANAMLTSPDVKKVACICPLDLGM